VGPWAEFLRGVAEVREKYFWEREVVKDQQVAVKIVRKRAGNHGKSQKRTQIFLRRERKNRVCNSLK
jgi:hypothetical protein